MNRARFRLAIHVHSPIEWHLIFTNLFALSMAQCLPSLVGKIERLLL